MYRIENKVLSLSRLQVEIKKTDCVVGGKIHVTANQYAVTMRRTVSLGASLTISVSGLRGTAMILLLFMFVAVVVVIVESFYGPRSPATAVPLGMHNAVSDYHNDLIKSWQRQGGSKHS